MKPVGKKLAIFLPTCHSGGAERVMITLSGAFAERGVDVVIVLADGDGVLRDTIPETVRVVDLESRRVLTALPGLVAFLNRERPDTLISTLTYANIVAVWAGLISRSPTRIWVRESTTVSLAAEEFSTVAHRIQLRLVRRFYSMASGVIAPSEGVAKDLVTLGVPASHIVTILNPAISTQLTSLAGQGCGHPWLKDPTLRVVLGVGRLTRAKDFESLIRAFAEVHAVVPGSRLVIVGEGELRPQLEQLADSLGLSAIIDLPGYLVNPFPYMANADVYVLSSLREGMPNALIEALACGCPVVSTDCKSGPQEILDGGRFGELVAVGETKALAQAILNVLAGRVKPVAPAQLDRHLDSYQLENIASRYLDTLFG